MFEKDEMLQGELYNGGDSKMIINVSGRTDIVAFYSEWFMNRYKEGYIDIRNPFYPKQVSRLYMEDVDAIVFCTKNPKPLLGYIDSIEKPVNVQVTLTGYQTDIEPNVPDKKEIIEAIKKLSAKIGEENVDLRYDPILINDKYTMDYHIRAFEKLCTLLEGCCNRIIVSFVDEYKNVNKHSGLLKLIELSDDDKRKLARHLAESAHQHGFTIQTCYENIDLTAEGFSCDVCVGKELAQKLTGKTRFRKWQARKCGCVEMVDIGYYNCCSHFCRYCYANYDEVKVNANKCMHNPKSSLLIGELGADDIVKIRKSR